MKTKMKEPVDGKNVLLRLSERYFLFSEFMTIYNLSYMSLPPLQVTAWAHWCSWKEERASIEFVQLAATFSHVEPATMHLKKTLEEHYLVVHPKNGEMIREKRNLKSNRRVKQE